MPTIFSQIFSGEVPACIVYRDEICCAFMDINPVNPGHVLLVPKVEVDLLWRLPADVYAHLWVVAQRLEPAIREVTGCRRVGVAVVGFDVPHVHIHLVPVNGGKELDFNRAQRASPKDLRLQADKIIAALA